MNARRTGVAIVATLALHGLGWWLLHTPPPLRVAAPAAAPRVVLRLVPPTPQPPRPAPIAAPAPTRRPAVQRAPNEPETARQTTPAAPAVSAFEPIIVAPQTQRPLELALPQRPAASAPASIRDQALRDERSNSPRATPSERFAQNLGSDETLIEEARGEGRIRVRQGRTCLDVHVARNAELDPFNMSYRPTPKIVDDCSRP